MQEHDELKWLMDWYTSQCDGGWEHQYGIKIETLDNPGWAVTIELEETELEGRAFEPMKAGASEIASGDESWIVCRVEGSDFKGFGGPRDLGNLIGVFRVWASSPGIMIR